MKSSLTNVDSRAIGEASLSETITVEKALALAKRVPGFKVMEVKDKGELGEYVRQNISGVILTEAVLSIEEVKLINKLLVERAKDGDIETMELVAIAGAIATGSNAAALQTSMMLKAAEIGSYKTQKSSKQNNAPTILSQHTSIYTNGGERKTEKAIEIG